MTTPSPRPARRTRRARTTAAAVTGGGLLALAGSGVVGIAGQTATAGAVTLPDVNTTVRAATGSGYAVAATAERSGGGYWTAWTDGTVVASGSAPWEGDLRGTPLSGRIVGITPTPDGQGYWLLGADGGVFAFGDAAWYGSAAGLPLSAPVVGIESTPDGRGYWVVASDGGVFAFGDATYFGSMGGITLDSPVVGIASTPGGGGYWLAAADGGVFAFGDAPYRGSMGGIPLDQPVVGLAGTPSGNGYWLVASDGGVFAFGDAPFAGSGSGSSAGVDTVGVVAEGAGYWMLGGAGDAVSYGAPLAPTSAVTLDAVSASSDPGASIPPSAAFLAHCLAGAPGCDAFALSDIDGARALEGLGPLALPAGYAQLGTTAQLVTVLNAERASRGLLGLTEVGVLDRLAIGGAAAGADPAGPAGTQWSSVLSQGYASPLAADFMWMYDDGVGGTNTACPAAGGAGCWAHRQNILVPWADALGVASVGANLAAVFVQL